MAGYQNVEREKGLDVVKRSNAMINASYQSTLFAKKITALAISRMSLQDDVLVAVLPVTDIKSQLGLKGNSLYNQIKGVSVETLGQKLLFEAEDKSSFDLYNVFSRAKYDEDAGALRLEFTNEIKQHTMLVQKNYTIMRLASLLNFESSHSYRIYELMSTEKYKIPEEEGRSYSFRMSLVDFRFKIGLVNTEKAYIAEMMDSGKPLKQVYEAALERAEVQRRQQREARQYFEKSKNSSYVEEKPDVLYHRWTDLKKRVLDKAVDEINNSDFCEIAFSYAISKKGKNGKAEELSFTIWRNPNYKKVRDDIGFTPARERPTGNAKVEEVRGFIVEPLSEKDVLSILKAANDNVEVVRVAYMMARNKGHIQNLTGWLIAAIKQGWEDHAISIESAEHAKAKRRTAGFNNFKQNAPSDIEEWERAIISSQMADDDDTDVDEMLAGFRESDESAGDNNDRDMQMDKINEIMADASLTDDEKFDLIKKITTG